MLVMQVMLVMYIANAGNVVMYIMLVGNAGNVGNYK